VTQYRIRALYKLSSTRSIYTRAGVPVENACAMAYLYAPPPSVGPDLRDLAVSLGHTPASWQAAGHAYEPYTGCFRANPYVPLGPPPPQVVAASAAPAPKESAAVGPDGCLIQGTRADALLQSWCAPIAAGQCAAKTPLLVVGQSLWHVVVKAMRQLHAYPVTYDRISLSELPCDEMTLMAFRANTVRARVIMVAMPSVPVAAMYADGMPRLQVMLPQHSFVFFTPAADVDHLPAPVRERYTVLTWRDTHAPAVPPAVPPPDRGQVMAMIEASHARLGGVIGLGINAGQRLGLERTPYRDAAFAAMHLEAAAHARRIAAMEGDIRDTKRVKLSDFNRGSGVVMHNKAHETTGFD
jgi:hypothetical protein